MDIEHSKAGEGEKTTPTGVAMEAPLAAVGAEPTVEEKLRQLLGGVAVGGEAAPAYATICEHFAKKMRGRIPTKPIDLTHFYEGADRRVSHELLAALRVAVGDQMAAELGAALETLWQRVLPKIGIGTMGMTAKMTPEERPLKTAYDNGVRLFPLMDPLTVMGPMGAKMNNVEAQGNDLRDCDLSTADSFVMSAPQIFVKADSTPEEVRGVIRRSFDLLRKELGPLKVRVRVRLGNPSPNPNPNP